MGIRTPTRSVGALLSQAGSFVPLPWGSRAVVAGSNSSILFAAERGTLSEAEKERISAERKDALKKAMASATMPQLQHQPSTSPAPPPPVMPTSSEGITDALVWKNVDGMRMDDGRYQLFLKKVKDIVPEERCIVDPVRTFAYGTDASFYRLNPKMVVKVHSEEEVQRLLPLARKTGTPVTFRAAGTSLSGQAITDSILVKLSHTGTNFRRYEVRNGGKEIMVEPGLIGGEVNRILAAYKKQNNLTEQYKIGPDPSSIDSCMIGGIVSNNSSGMCCGVAQNTYHTLKDLRVVFLDGTVLDTSDQKSRQEFIDKHPEIVQQISSLAREVQADEELSDLIRKKFRIKCTTGYSLNALIDFSPDDPIEIIKRLIIGSEGTIGFVSQATYHTVPDDPHKASAFIMFDDIKEACNVAAVLRNETKVDAVELFDRASLREAESVQRMVELKPNMVGCGPRAAALLIECRGSTQETLQASIDEVTNAVLSSRIPILDKDVVFNHEPADYKVYWDIRKGLIPMVGGARETGTSMLIEDVACSVEKLGDMTVDLIEMFQRHGYPDASLFGHALEGNLHLVFAQGFRTDAEVKQYADMMQELCEIVALRYGGSLKAEHGTGRNVAPFVEMEWGKKATDLMWRIKKIFDPEFMLNPGVILNDDPDIHKKSLKPSPEASSLVDRCIECGFCESNCPSRDFSLTPRQRITVWREINRLRQLPQRTKEEDQRMKEFLEIFEYQGKDTCAADGMCQEKCPVKINTGELIKSIRADRLSESKSAQSFGMFMARNFNNISSVVPSFLNLVDAMHGTVGATPLKALSSVLNRISNNMVPEWNPYMPTGARPLKDPSTFMNEAIQSKENRIERKVVYIPTCVTRMMGPSRGDSYKDSVHERMLGLLSKAGYKVIYPEGIKNTCCGMMFNSRGLKDIGNVKGLELEQAILKASENGKYPVVCDTSPCLSTMKHAFTSPELKYSLYEPLEFIDRFLLDKLDFEKTQKSVAVHVPCSSKKMGKDSVFLKIANLCAEKVSSTDIPCCGMAGDRGLRYPELTASSLQHLKLPTGCTDGYSTSRTCEMSLSNHSGVMFRNLIYLVDQSTKPKSA